MRNAIRSPLTWMVVAELAVVGALVTLAWAMVVPAAQPAAAAPVAAAPEPAADDGASPPDIPSLSGEPERGPLPGLNVDPAFWRHRLAELNRDQVWLADFEWRAVHAATTAAKDYVENVVLPAVRRAEKAAVG